MNSYSVQDATLLALLATSAEFLTPSWQSQFAGTTSDSSSETDQIEWDAEWDLDTEWDTALPAALKLPAFSRSAEIQTSDSSGLPVMREITAHITQLSGVCTYKTCRIWVDHPPRRLFAIQIEEQYYSLTRLLPTHVAALKLAYRLSEVNHVLITAADPNAADPNAADQTPHAVWLWQPEARLAE